MRYMFANCIENIFRLSSIVQVVIVKLDLKWPLHADFDYIKSKFYLF